MDRPAQQEPWWRRRRWRLALVAWLMLPIAYLIASGPTYFALRRGWVATETYYALYKPVGDFLYDYFPVGRRVFVLYTRWWWELAASD
jgi:hypothetical protein